jgi:NADH-quinone oxidoreductase subunit M
MFTTIIQNIIILIKIAIDFCTLVCVYACVAFAYLFVFLIILALFFYLCIAVLAIYRFFIIILSGPVSIKRIRLRLIVETKRFLQGRPSRFLNLLANLQKSNPFKDTVPVLNLIPPVFHDFRLYVMKEMRSARAFFRIIARRKRGPLSLILLTLFHYLYSFFESLIKLLKMCFLGFLYLIENHIENLKTKYPNRIMGYPTIWQRVRYNTKRFPFRVRLIIKAYDTFCEKFALCFNVLIFIYTKLHKLLNVFPINFIFALFLSLLALFVYTIFLSFASSAILIYLIAFYLAFFLAGEEDRRALETFPPFSFLMFFFMYFFYKILFNMIRESYYLILELCNVIFWLCNIIVTLLILILYLWFFFCIMFYKMFTTIIKNITKLIKIAIDFCTLVYVYAYIAFAYLLMITFYFCTIVFIFALYELITDLLAVVLFISALFIYALFELTTDLLAVILFISVLFIYALFELTTDLLVLGFYLLAGGIAFGALFVFIVFTKIKNIIRIIKFLIPQILMATVSFLFDPYPLIFYFLQANNFIFLSLGASGLLLLSHHIVGYNILKLSFDGFFTKKKTLICLFFLIFGGEFFYSFVLFFNAYSNIYISFLCFLIIFFAALWALFRGAFNFYLVPDLKTIRFLFGFISFTIIAFFLPELTFFSELIQSFTNNINIENDSRNIFGTWIRFINSYTIINPYLILFIFPLLFSFFILLLKNKETIKISALFFSFLLFFYVIYLCILFDSNKETLQFVYKGIFGISPLTYSFYFAFDGISLSLVLLTSFLIPLCLLTLNTVYNKIKEFIILLFITQIFLNIAFTTFNLLVFYVAFEAILIPMFILILIWGSRERKIRSVYLLFFYTLIGSVPFLLSICYLIHIGSTDNIIYLNSSGYQLNIPFRVQEILCYCFTLSFAVKMPMFPIHIWLPEAHVEAPTSGSILLAGILLKLGGYGFFRFCLPLFSEAMQSISPLIIMLSLLGIFFIGIITLVQEDLKKIIAYSSVAHMNLVIIALFSNNLEAFQSSIIVMLSHGIVSGGLFYIIGALYNVSHTRSLFEHGGLARVMPFFTFFFLTLTFANISLPGTVSFVGEFLIFQSILNYSYLATFLAMTTVIFGAAYSLFLLCRLCYGNLKLQFISYYRDLILKDNIALTVICFLIVFFGFNPKGITDLINAASFFY